MMKSELIYDYLECKIEFNGKMVDLPEDVKLEIQENWDQLLLSGKKFTNGELFTIKQLQSNSNSINLIVEKTYYDHYLFSVKENFESEHICRSLAANVLPYTADGYIVLGEMGSKTSLPNKIKFIGGAFSIEDSHGNFLDPWHCAKREFNEEIGLDLNKQENVIKMEPKYFLTRKKLSFINILFEAQIVQSSSVVLHLFERHKQKLLCKGQESKIQSIILLKNDKK